MSEILDDDPDVGFLVRAMLTRDPKKRQVKPVQHHMLTLDFPGLEDSEDDDDYQLPQSKGGGSDSVTDESEESSAEDSRDEGSEGEKGGVCEVVQVDVTLDEDIDIHSEQHMDTVMSTESVVTPKQMKVLICGVCLQDYSGESDEIVECDGCGVAVHEGCYGMTESISVASTESSASTEPWFCEPCKAGVSPLCELCPNTGGIFKETDAGRWCHLVCALYVPGVAFGDIDQLTPVTLFEMPYSKWGAKECILCEDSRFSRTGVCIGCDAGLCRNYFHVTCAQREGLLSEASPDEDIADPFFAHCKQHAEKLMMKMKRRNWLATQSRLKTRKEGEDLSDVEKSRVKRKLERHRRKYTESRASRPPCWIPQEKMPRMLTTSATALRKLMKKAELVGINNQTPSVAVQTDVRKKWHLAPAFTVDYFSYFMDRNDRILKMRTQRKDLTSVREKLRSQEKGLRNKYEKLSSSVSSLRGTYSRLFEECTQLWTHINQLSRKTYKLPSVLKPKLEVVSQADSVRVVSPPPAVIHQCSLCDSKEDQHLLVKCDECLLFSHLGCLDPPLTRMPKKTKLYGWQCSECIQSSTDDSDISVDTSAPMRLRDTIKEPQKFAVTQTGPQKKKSEKKKKKKKKVVKTSDKESEASGSLNKSVKKSPGSVKTKKDVDIRRECTECGRPGDNSTLVRCDECKNCYHFHCLDPPMKHTPKQHGYGWICTKCTSSVSESDGDEEDKPDVSSRDEVEESRQRMETCEQEEEGEDFLVLGVESEEMEDMDIE